MGAVAGQPSQVYLRPGQREALRALAKKRGVSMAELVRQGVDYVLSEVSLEEDPIMSLVGMFDSGVTDLAENHDKYLAAICEAENR